MSRVAAARFEFAPSALRPVVEEFSLGSDSGGPLGSAHAYRVPFAGVPLAAGRLAAYAGLAEGVNTAITVGSAALVAALGFSPQQAWGPAAFRAPGRPLRTPKGLLVLAGLGGPTGLDRFAQAGIDVFSISPYAYMPPPEGEYPFGIFPCWGQRAIWAAVPHQTAVFEVYLASHTSLGGYTSVYHRIPYYRATPVPLGRSLGCPLLVVGPQGLDSVNDWDHIKEAYTPDPPGPGWVLARTAGDDGMGQKQWVNTQWTAEAREAIRTAYTPACPRIGVACVLAGQIDVIDAAIAGKVSGVYDQVWTADEFEDKAFAWFGL